MRINGAVQGIQNVNYESMSQNRESVEADRPREIAPVENDITVEKFKDAVGEEDFENLVDNLKDITSTLKYTRMEFNIHDDTKRIMVKVFDRSNDELIMEVPPEKFLDLLAGLWRQAGLIVDERV